MVTKRKFWLMSLMITILLGIFGMTGVSHAATTSDTGANFTVTPVYPSNQVGGQPGYFQLKVSPGQTGSVGIKIDNYGTTDQTFTVTPTKATTSDGGQIDYTPVKRSLDKSAQYRLPQLFSPKQTVTVPAKTTKTVTFTYKVPANGFKGMLLGGFYVYSNTRQTGQSGNVTNRYAMVVGISLSQDAPKRLAPSLKAGTAKVTSSGDTTAVITQIRNVVPTYFRGMHIKTTVTKQGQSKVRYRQTMINGSMAPTSNFNYTLNVGKKVATPGHYTEHITLKARGKTWHFDRNFTIHAMNTAKQVTHANRWGNVWWLWLIVIVAVLAVVGGFFYWLGRRKRK